MEEKKEDFSQIPPAGASPSQFAAPPPDYGSVQYGAQESYAAQYQPNKVDSEVHYMVRAFQIHIRNFPLARRGSGNQCNWIRKS